MGVDDVLRARQERLVGILNGIDTTVWDPAHDRHLAEPYACGRHGGQGRGSPRRPRRDGPARPQRSAAGHGHPPGRAEGRRPAACRRWTWSSGCPCRWPCSVTATPALAAALAAAAARAAAAGRVPAGLRRRPGPRPVRRRRPPRHAEPLRAVRPRADAGHALRDAAGRHRRRRVARHGRRRRRPPGGRDRRRCQRHRPRWRCSTRCTAASGPTPRRRRRKAMQKRGMAHDWSWAAPARQHLELLPGAPRRQGVTIVSVVPVVRSEPHVLVIVLAGGEGKRLAPLTADRAKPAVPFGGSYRIIDFVLSNFANAALPEDRRAHAVQEPQPRPPHHARRGGSRRCSAAT